MKLWTTIGVMRMRLYFTMSLALWSWCAGNMGCVGVNNNIFFPFQTFNRSDIFKYDLCQGSRCLFAFYGGETYYHRYLFWLQLSNLLLFFWLVNFSLALEQCSLAGAFASYYWANNKPWDIPSCPLFLSFFRAIRSGHNLFSYFVQRLHLNLFIVCPSVLTIYRLSSDITLDLWHLGL